MPVADITGVRFTHDDSVNANLNWGFNCGPAALAAIARMTPDEVRQHMGDFESKGYTNPSMMFAALRSVGLKFQNREFAGAVAWPRYGLCRIQWEGPWTKPGVPIAVRYRHTHWVGARTVNERTYIYDVNAMTVGGWISVEQWSWDLVPWLLSHCEPKADGKWHVTHMIEVE